MGVANVTDPRFARIWINATGLYPTPTPAAAKKLCAMNSKALNQSMATGTAVVPDCTDITKVSYVKRTATSKDASISGTGYFETEMRNDLQNMMDGAVSVPIIFEILADVANSAVAAANDGYYKGNFFLETFNIIANNTDSYMTVDLNFVADGPISWTPNTTTP